MNPRAEYDRAMQGVQAMLSQLNTDGLWYIRGQLDAVASYPRFTREVGAGMEQGKVINLFAAAGARRYT